MVVGGWVGGWGFGLGGSESAWVAEAGVVVSCELGSWADRKLRLERVTLLGEEYESLDRFGEKRGLVRLGTGGRGGGGESEG